MEVLPTFVKPNTAMASSKRLNSSISPASTVEKKLTVFYSVLFSDCIDNEFI